MVSDDQERKKREKKEMSMFLPRREYENDIVRKWHFDIKMIIIHPPRCKVGLDDQIPRGSKHVVYTNWEIV